MKLLPLMIEAVAVKAIPATSRPFFLASVRAMLARIDRMDGWTPRLSAMLDSDSRLPAVDLWSAWIYAVGRDDVATCNRITEELKALGGYADAKASLEGIAKLHAMLRFTRLRRAH